MNEFEAKINKTESNPSGIIFSRRIIDDRSNLKTDLKALFPKEESIFAKEKYKKIITFAGKNSGTIDDYIHQGSIFRIINLSTASPLIEPELVQAYLSEQAEVSANGIYDNCIQISESVVKKGVLSGRIYSDYLTKLFTGWSNHAVNYDYLPDGSVLGIDFTASTNIDKNAGNFHTLAIRTLSFYRLRLALSDLYGGDWLDYPVQNQPPPIRLKIHSLATI